jgi:glucose/arabinose dehydrogenase
MGLRNWIVYLLVVAGLLVLVAGCGPVEPTTMSASSTAQPTSSATNTAALSPEASATPDATDTEIPPPTSTPTVAPTSVPAASLAPTEPTLPAPTQTAAPTPTDTPVPSATVPPSPPAIVLEPVLGGFERPVYVTHAGNSAQLFVVEKVGRIRLVENGQLLATPVLDITDRVGSGGSEQGLLSVAFPADYPTRLAFYVNYTDRNGHTVVARYRGREGDPHLADPGSEQVLLRIEQPAANHNGGQLQFGADGYLYVGMGDGGQAGDPWGNAQNPGVLLGKLLRLRVTDTETYMVPSDNPFVGQSTYRPEIWALGLRNPWRFSFDRATGDLYVADVGQNRYEEVNWQPAGSAGGENYGWDVMEGRHCYEPSTGCEPTGLVQPIAEYDHNLGCSVTGGYVYRGSQIPQLEGVYIYGDFCTGNIWGVWRQPSGGWTGALVAQPGLSISSFGEDAVGELYALGYNDGTLYHLVARP